MFERTATFTAWMLCLGLACALVAPGLARGGEGPMMDRIRLGNGLIERTFSQPKALPVVTDGLRLAPAGGASPAAWCAPGRMAPDCVLTVTDPATSRTQRLRFGDRQSGRVLARRGDGSASLTLTQRREDWPLVIEQHYECPADHAVIRQWATITNTGSRPLTLDEVSLLSLGLAVPSGDLSGLYGFERLWSEKARPRWFQPHPFDLTSSPSLEFQTGRHQAAAWLALWRRNRAEGMIVGWETAAPTWCRVGAGATGDPAGDAAPGLCLILRPRCLLQPGETFTVPRAFVSLYRGDLDEGCYLTQRYAEEHIAWPNPGPDFPYVMFNSWGYERAIDDALARQAIDLCARLGLEMFVADFGWEGPDWEPRPETFPHGLAPLSDLCHDRGMKFGTHFSFANVAESSRLYREHPDWTHGEGCWAFGQGKSSVYALSLGLPEAREWAVNKVTEVLDRDQVDWFLTDTALWGTIDSTKHPVTADQDYLAATGFERTMDEIHQRRPGVLIEHCDGGLSLINYRMMAQHVTSITCDNAQAIDTRLSVWDLSRILPPRYLDKYQQEWRSHYANRSCLLGGPWILMMPIHTLEPGSRDWNELVEDIALYKHYRGRIREGKVLHLLAPGLPNDPGWDGWDAIGAYNPNEDAAIVFAFRTKPGQTGGGPARHVIPMKSLNPDQIYQVTFQDAKQTYRASGREIMRDGFALTLESYATDPHSHCSEVILVEPDRP